MADTGRGAAVGAQPGTFVDPYRAYNFKLVIQGVTEGHFTDCSGLGISVEPIRYREGGTAQVVHCIPGPVSYSDVELRYGVTASTELWDWMKQVAAGRGSRRNVSILLLDSDGATEVLRWDLINAWPCRWGGAVLGALSHEVAIETLTLVFESLERA